MTDRQQESPYSTGDSDRTSGSRPSLAIGLLFLRVSMGGLMPVRGVPKLMGFSNMADKFPFPWEWAVN